MGMLIFELELPGKTVHFPFDQGDAEVTGGAHPDNTVYLPFKGVSRFHFTLAKTNGTWILRDLESKNGTRVNGKRVTEGPLKAGDRVEAGIIQLHVREASRPDEPVVSIPKPPNPPAPNLDTEEIGFLSSRDTQEFFFFPNLTFPEEMILGRAARMLEVYQQVNAVVRSNASVLIVGETGVGKELIAKTIHLSSQRAGMPFVALNCANLPAELAEAELFGVGRRVATGVDERRGVMAAADGGTLFLDEVNAFSPALQPKVLRALEERLVFPLGTQTPVRTDFRLIAATSREPKDLIALGLMREDLYHRLATMEVRLPPLRERREDLEPFILEFMERICREHGKPVEGISRKALACLKQYAWPGNVRELKNLLESVILLAYPGEILDVKHLPQKVLSSTFEEEVRKIVGKAIGDGRLNYHQLQDEVAVKLITHVLKVSGGSVPKAAEKMGLSAYGLRKMLKRLHIEAK